jgi:hypothetical protein
VSLRCGFYTNNSVYQYLPYRRVTDLFGSVIGLPLSEGTVDAVLEEMAEKAGGAYREIKRRIERSAVVGADETGCHVNGKKHWMYVWQNDGLTYLMPSEHRNYETIEREFPEGLPLATLVSGLFSGAIENPGGMASDMRGSASFKRAEEL